MRLLYGYLRGYWKLVLLALLLATVNQVFSLLDPLIFRHVIDQYATRYRDYTHAQFLHAGARRHRGSRHVRRGRGIA